MPDLELIDKGEQARDEALAELVRQHANWIYGVAVRRVGDRHLAEDVVQAVFMVLHRKAPRLRGERMAGWLFKVTQYAGAQALRGEQRRKRRETEAAMIGQHNATSSENPWDQLAPAVDALVASLRQRDREAILLRFYREMSFAEVGKALGTSEDAARKRVDRAIATLRDLAQRRGISMSATALTAVLCANLPAQSAPAGLVAVAATAAFSSTTSAVSVTANSIAKGVTVMLRQSKLKVGAMVVLAALVITAGGPLLVHQLMAHEPQAAPAVMGRAAAATLPTSGRYTAMPVVYGDNAIGIAITDHVESRFYYYMEKQDKYLHLEAIVDLAKVGQPRLDYTPIARPK